MPTRPAWQSWLFIAIPGLLAMLFAVLSYSDAATRVTNMEQSMSRALLVALLTWIAVTTLIVLALVPGTQRAALLLQLR